MVTFSRAPRGRKGAKARKKALSPERRREIAQKAIEERWRKAGKRRATGASCRRERR